MRELLRIICAVVALVTLASVAAAQAVTVAPGATVESILAAQQGKKVTLKLGPSDELTGTVKVVTKDVVQISELAGREFFDAIVDIKSVKAVIVRTRN
jgi:hypothetical protein